LVRELQAEATRLRSQAAEDDERYGNEVADLKRRLREEKAKSETAGPRTHASANEVAELRIQAKESERLASAETVRAETAEAEVAQLRKKLSRIETESADNAKRAQQGEQRAQAEADALRSKLEQEVRRHAQ